jgi:hypothetical protein
MFGISNGQANACCQEGGRERARDPLTASHNIQDIGCTLVDSGVAWSEQSQWLPVRQILEVQSITIIYWTHLHIGQQPKNFGQNFFNYRFCHPFCTTPPPAAINLLDNVYAEICICPLVNLIGLYQQPQAQFTLWHHVCYRTFSWPHVNLRKNTCNARREVMRSYLATASSQNTQHRALFYVAGCLTSLG